MTASPAARLPGHLDLRHRLGPVRFQGSRLTCLPFAASAGHEMVRRAAQALSPEFLVHAAVQRGALANGGIRMDIARASLREAGQCTEAHWPYEPKRNCALAGYGPTPAAIADAATRLVVRHRLIASPDVRTIKEATASGDAVILGAEYHRSTRDGTGADGRIPLPDPSEAPLGGHAYLVAGYDDDAEALLLRNSWGPTWGEGGYGWMPYDYPDIFLRELWVFGL